MFGTIDTWILWKLTGGSSYYTDHTNASRTLLYNIINKDWDSELFNLFEIPKINFPKIKNSVDCFGFTNIKEIKNQINITGIAGDQQSALYAQGGYNVGMTKCTYGTGCFILTNTGDDIVYSNKGLLSTITLNKQGAPKYGIEGSVFIGGAAIQWLRDELGIINKAKETEKMAYSVNNTNGVYMVPAFVGLGAPYWNMDARGSITGITRGTNKNHIVRAALNSIAYQVNDIIQIMRKVKGLEINELLVDGGASQNNYLMQFQANISNVLINRPQNIESTVIGAAILSSHKINFWSDKSKIRINNKLFKPEMDEPSRENRIKKWNKAIKTTF